MPDIPLQGNGFIIRGWKKGDEVSLQKNANNPKVSACLMDRFPSPYTIEDAVNWVNVLAGQDPVLNFAITINDEVIGGIGLEPRQDVYRKTAIIGYWLSEELWGKGIMPEAVKLVTDYAFTYLDFIRIQASVYSKNPASMRVLEKAGYTKEGIMKNAVIKGGEILDEHLYAVLK
ncbi:GNAT family N-acetyltransferase [Mucilaginibacter sp. BT774]|uniref:GNAT family N-acetyltransferase n=1 Tax=Mucilaginibacter sp. BT774 TaxID=3062276 RepID=UPI0026760326|nr:GNAT family protein [Mucilaginibacter sp. BT774]MDO3626651.1 GNAT family protein [Mucilaginibacter sp. BT774]